MVLMSGKLDQVTQRIARITSETLGARVLLTDAGGRVLAGSAPGCDDGGDVPLHEYEACIRVPFRVDGQTAHAIIGEPVDGEVISPRLARMVIETAVSQSAIVVPDNSELKNRFIYELLRGADGEQEDLLREGEILGMDFSRPRAVLLIDASGYILVSSPLEAEARLKRVTLRAQHVIASVVSFFRLPSDTICAYIGDGQIAVLKAASTQDLDIWSGGGEGTMNPSWANLTALKRACRALLERLRRDTATSVNIGVGRYHPGIRGLARSYADASAAVSLGRHTRGGNAVHCLDELGVAAFMGVADPQTKYDLAAHLLSPLDSEPELQDTLTALFEENCSVTSTANRLSIHRNTLTYRLDKIASLTGLDPRKFDDAVQIRLATVARSI